MHVETYEEISLHEQGGAIINEEVSEEALALIETLGLTGQAQLLSRRTLGEGEIVETRMPFRFITAEEHRVFSALFPVMTEIGDYDATPIPLQVLQVAAKAKEFFPFGSSPKVGLYVMHPQNHREPDPVLIGRRSKPGATWDVQTFLLARWGEALLPLDELRVKAHAVLLPSIQQKVVEAKAQLAVFEAALTHALENHLRGGQLGAPHILISA